MGSTPIPGSNAEPLYSDIATFLWALKKEGLKESTIVCNYSKVLRHLSKNCVKMFFIEKQPPFKIYYYAPSGTGQDKKLYIGRRLD